MRTGDDFAKNHHRAHGRTSSEVILFIGAQEESLRLFFGHFLIVHLAPGSEMDGYLGFRPPKPYASLGRNFKPQIGGHLLLSV